MSGVDLPERPDGASQLASALALVTTLTAAAETTAAIHARRRGDLPSGTRVRADVRTDLVAAREDAQTLLRQIASSAVVVEEADVLDQSVRMAGLALTLKRLGRVLHRLHQHLLGLYDPAGREISAAERAPGTALGGIDEALIEDVRALGARAASLLDDAHDAARGPALVAFAGDGLRVLVGVPTGDALR